VSGDGRDDDDQTSEFRRTLDGVKPLRGPRPVAPPSSAPPPRREDGPTRLEVTHEGERMAGGVPGVDRHVLERLRRGRIPVDRTVDRHGHDLDGARRALADALERAWRDDARCLLVIHGRGLHSESGPRIKEALPGWLAAPPHGPRVLAFTSADPARGGPGATCVLLRRKR
jgi:DNA-nicking Smr family endonuclease